MTLWTLIADFFTLDPELTAQAVQQEAWIPIAIAAVSAAGSLYSKYKEGEAMKDQANKGNEMSERARQQAMARLSPEQMYTAFQTFFPGLVNDPNQGTSMGAPPKMVGQGEGAGMANYDQNDGAITQAASYDPNPGAGAASYGVEYDVARADGGSVEAGQNVLVGEEGPEVLQMQTDGNVIPNPGTTAQADAGVGAGDAAPPVEPPSTGDPGSPPGQKTVEGGFEQDPVTATDLSMGHVFDMLMNPGRFSTADYERRQEEASAGYQSRVQDIDAQAMAGGIDPGSGAASTMKASAAKQEAGIKSEAARDQQLIEQQLRRADIGAGQQMLMQMMNYILQLQGTRANAASGSFANPQVVNTGMGDGIAQFGDLAAQAVQDYNDSKGGGSNNDAADQSGVYGPPIQGD